jgi:hypothetical protein
MKQSLTTTNIDKKPSPKLTSTKGKRKVSDIHTPDFSSDDDELELSTSPCKKHRTEDSPSTSNNKVGSNRKSGRALVNTEQTTQATKKKIIKSSRPVTSKSITNQNNSNCHVSVARINNVQQPTNTGSPNNSYPNHEETIENTQNKKSKLSEKIEEEILKIKQYEYKMMRFEDYRNLSSGPRRLSKLFIEQTFPEYAEFFPRDGVKMEEEGEEESVYDDATRSSNEED